MTFAMKKTIYIAALLFGVGFFSSCENSVEQPAKDVLAVVQSEYEAGNYNKAKALIDSIKSAHPKAYKTLREAEAMRRKVLLKEKERDVAYFEEELKELEARRDAMLSAFEYSKNAKYQDVGVYSLPSQAISANVFNNYLRATVNEYGEAFITSYYRGKRIGCKEVKVGCGDVYVTASSSIYSWSGKEYGVYVERRDFKHSDDGGMMDFIASAQGTVTVELIGNDSKFSYELRQADVEAIAKVLELSDVLRSIVECRDMLDAARFSLDFLLKGEQRLRKDSVTMNGEGLRVKD